MLKLTEALANAGIPVPSKDTETFKIVRWGRNNRYWLKKFDGGYVFGDFVSGLNAHVFERNFKGKSLEEAQIRMREACKKVEFLSSTVNEQAATVAQNLLMESLQSVTCHAYFRKKRIFSHDLKEHKGSIIVPAYDVNGKLWTLQFIDSEGNKRFLSGGKKKGCFFPIGSLDRAEKAFICEGFATGATIYECSETPVVVAFDAGNLKPVVQAIHAKYPELKIIICADNDAYGEVNTGVEKAKEAAQVAGTQVIIPKFKDVSTKPTDFNDLMILEGKDTVKSILEQALKKTEEDECTDIPEGFSLSDDGLFCIDKKTQELTRISNYIKVTAFTKSNDEMSRLVEFHDYKGNTQSIVIKSSMFTKDGEQIRVSLLKKGFIFAGTLFSKRKLMEYMSSSVPTKEITLVSKTGFSNNVYIRPDNVLGITDEEIVLDTAIQDKSYAVSGTLQDWNDNVARWCMGNSRLIFAISSAFASMLLKACSMPNFGFHFVGNSSSGKTTCLNIAASVFGTPDYVSTWKSTDNAMENTAFRRNDSLLILDELSEISPSKAGDVAYMLANGQGKKRLDKDCNARETMSWRLIFLSSGEVDLTSHMAEDSKASKAGQKVRLLNIPAKASKDSFGIFENLMGFQDGAEFSNYLRNKASKYYGTPSIAFIEKVLGNEKEIRAQF